MAHLARLSAINNVKTELCLEMLLRNLPFTCLSMATIQKLRPRDPYCTRSIECTSLRQIRHAISTSGCNGTPILGQLLGIRSFSCEAGRSWRR